MILLACYLIGSVPTAYIFVKLFHNKDITKEGSGNVGTLNAFSVSRSKIIAVIVLIIDFIKGFLPLMYISTALNLSTIGIFICAVLIIIGHNFSIWLSFRGGRGLATSAGVFAVFSYPLIIIWCIVWSMVFSFKRDVLFSNFFATLSLTFTSLIFKNLIFSFSSSVLSLESYNYFIAFTFVVTLLILSKHWSVLSKLFLINTAKSKS